MDDESQDIPQQPEPQQPDQGTERQETQQPQPEDSQSEQPQPEQPEGQETPQGFEPLTAAYERLRHSQDADELSEFARRPLPDRADQAAFSRATALLEAVAGNRCTPLEDRIHLAGTMPFPNVLVKLSEDPDPAVRRAVAGNEADKNWLVGRLTKDPDPEVRDTALCNPNTSWKMRLEGAQNPRLDAKTLDFLAGLGVVTETDAPSVLAVMVRRAAALNPNTMPSTLARLADDPSESVRRAAKR